MACVKRCNNSLFFMLFFSPYEFCQLLAQMCLFYWIHKWHSAFMCLFITSPCILLLHWEESSTKLNLWMNGVSRVTEWSRSSRIELFSAVWSWCSDQKLVFFFLRQSIWSSSEIRYTAPSVAALDSTKSDGWAWVITCHFVELSVRDISKLLTMEVA